MRAILVLVLLVSSGVLVFSVHHLHEQHNGCALAIVGLLVSLVMVIAVLAALVAPYPLKRTE